MSDSPKTESGPGDFSEAFVNHKNKIILDEMMKPGANVSSMAVDYLNYCDEGFNAFIDEKLASTNNSTEKKKLGRIRYEVNMARRNRLVEADLILRDILSAGALKQMEGKLNGYLRRGEIDMAFMVILQLNIEDAITANVSTAVQVMRHLTTLITEFQDQLMSPPVLLLRRLVRENDPNIRKQMIRQKVLVGQNADRAGKEALATPSPQCEHIVVQVVEEWGGPDVSVEEFRATVKDILAQMQGGSERDVEEIQEKCAVLLAELEQVISESGDRREAQQKSVSSTDPSSSSTSTSSSFSTEGLPLAEGESAMGDRETERETERETHDDGEGYFTML
eukprot:CAMPEP_0182425142 /NCGR_PEP_ID=MMETSP1167-20130531/11497_1 /TAXON_ID=2988 /ORGANISM="Mallomonas Sp, Strain CCMP3275" /LENGTH=335 /DNA_ID=CAMNT_0024605559 /DNA_START=178 /DNA_END=1185 /DNA_ORIENTATION=+